VYLFELAAIRSARITFLASCEEEFNFIAYLNSSLTLTPIYTFSSNGPKLANVSLSYSTTFKIAYPPAGVIGFIEISTVWSTVFYWRTSARREANSSSSRLPRKETCVRCSLISMASVKYSAV